VSLFHKLEEEWNDDKDKVEMVSPSSSRLDGGDLVSLSHKLEVELNETDKVVFPSIEISSSEALRNTCTSGKEDFDPSDLDAPYKLGTFARE